MSPDLLRAQQLLQLGRARDAIPFLRRQLVEDPHDAVAHSLLAWCLVGEEQFEPATVHAREAVGLSPDSGLAHSTLAHVMLQRRRYEEAEAAANEALRLEPEEADHYRLRAAIRMALERWPDALADAEAGLAIDPDDATCLSLRTQCLMRLGRKFEAHDSMDSALRRQPDSPLTHATQGWTLLERGDPKQALHHFREALRLDPEFEYAREGIIHAMKARHFVYRIFLSYMFWMMRLSPQARFGVIIGGFVGAQLVSRLAEGQPGWGVVLYPLLVIYTVFAVMTWLSVPLFNLLLRLSRFGRLALSKEQTRGASLLGLTILGAAAFLIAAFVVDDVRLLTAALVTGLLTIPVAAIYLCPSGWPRGVMATATAVLALLGAAWSARFAPVANLFIFGLIGSQFLANALGNARVTR